jgi:hypothetical protein
MSPSMLEFKSNASPLPLKLKKKRKTTDITVLIRVLASPLDPEIYHLMTTYVKVN